ncbi:MAG: proteasome regulatory subunit [Candidatus Woesearchaeota archaeon]|nr:proteasome regulatory subunit [Candidatus Woesearchaeota archaeon]
MKTTSYDATEDFESKEIGNEAPEDSEERIKKLEEENRYLKVTIRHLRGELERMRSPPLMVCEVSEIVAPDKAIISVPNGSRFVVRVASNLSVKAGDYVLTDQKNLNIVGKINTNFEFEANRFVILDKPNVSWKDIGGLDEEIEEIREVIELPLLKPELFKKVGIEPPKGVLLHGPPGTGKTLLAKAVASSTKSTFIEIVGSELVQKFIGEGAKLVKEVFSLARSKAPSIIFIDELDAIAAKRVELGTSGEREVQRTFMQLLAEIDGFKSLGNVKIIGCTNRKDILDEAVLRPGRLDRLIYIAPPNEKGREEIFKIHSKSMKTANINYKRLAKLTEGLSGADIKAICTEAGYFAIRKNKDVVSMKDFVDAINKIRKEEQTDKDYIEMFG